MRKQYVPINGRQIHVVTAGDAGPWLVLHHESPLSWKVWEPALSLLTNHFHVVMPDTAGYGNSDPGSPQWDIPDYAADLLQAIRSIVGDDRFLVAGCHTGASIALEVAKQSRPQALGAVFLGLPAYTPEKRAERLANWAPAAELKEDGSHLQEIWDRYTRIWHKPALQHKSTAVLDVLNVLERYHWGYQAAFRYDPLPALENLDAPVLFLTAEFDALASADKSCAELIGAQLIEIPGLHGQIPANAPGVLADSIHQFASHL